MIRKHPSWPTSSIFLIFVQLITTSAWVCFGNAVLFCSFLCKDAELGKTRSFIQRAIFYRNQRWGLWKIAGQTLFEIKDKLVMLQLHTFSFSSGLLFAVEIKLIPQFLACRSSAVTSQTSEPSVLEFVRKWINIPSRCFKVNFLIVWTLRCWE